VPPRRHVRGPPSRPATSGWTRRVPCLGTAPERGPGGRECADCSAGGRESCGNATYGGAYRHPVPSSSWAGMAPRSTTSCGQWTRPTARPATTRCPTATDTALECLNPPLSAEGGIRPLPPPTRAEEARCPHNTTSTPNANSGTDAIQHHVPRPIAGSAGHRDPTYRLVP
jgi:hypothetical protein